MKWSVLKDISSITQKKPQFYAHLVLHPTSDKSSKHQWLQTYPRMHTIFMNKFDVNTWPRHHKICHHCGWVILFVSKFNHRLIAWWNNFVLSTSLKALSLEHFCMPKCIFSQKSDHTHALVGTDPIQMISVCWPNAH